MHTPCTLVGIPVTLIYVPITLKTAESPFIQHQLRVNGPNDPINDPLVPQDQGWGFVASTLIAQCGVAQRRNNL